ncbi:MAG: YdcF family protein, partial [Candidatus Angelobacter sp.]
MATKRWKKWLLWLLVLAPACYAAVVYWRIVNQSAHDESRTADAIVVFGAAEYDGRPSPVYKARLDRAAQLYHRGLAPMVIITGGSGNDPRFSEGVVGREYLKTL